jgi:hypothetical protein
VRGLWVLDGVRQIPAAVVEGLVDAFGDPPRLLKADPGMWHRPPRPEAGVLPQDSEDAALHRVEGNGLAVPVDPSRRQVEHRAVGQDEAFGVACPEAGQIAQDRRQLGFLAGADHIERPGLAGLARAVGVGGLQHHQEACPAVPESRRGRTRRLIPGGDMRDRRLSQRRQSHGLVQAGRHGLETALAGRVRQGAAGHAAFGDHQAPHRRIAPPRQVQSGFVVGGRCFYWLHTHDATGIIHIESPVQKTFTLGDFFAIWGEPLSRTDVAGKRGPVTVYVDGRLSGGDPAAIPLTEHREITLEIGAPLVKPPRYTFPAGL